jgi:predicted nucleotidyltransferase
LLTAQYGHAGQGLQSCQIPKKVFCYNARMDAYQLTAQKRLQQQQEVVTQRREKAWELAKTAAALLKEEFGAARVAVFGSLVHPQLFHRRSDVDLAVWGLAGIEYYRAVSRLLSLDPDISFDLVEVEHASPRLREKIEREGQLI